MNEYQQRHLDWIQAIKDAKKQHVILTIIDDIREEGYIEKREAARIEREQKAQTK